MISLRGIRVCYGQETALNAIDLAVGRERTCAVIGPSGCGKTTLLLAIAGLLRPSSGQVLVNGEELHAARRETGIILQNGGLLPWKTAWDNVALGMCVRGHHAADINEKVAAVMADLGILDYRDRYPAELSGGQRQRTAIARTLVLEPDLLLLDEAASSLDAINREILQNLILDLYLKNPVTLVMVTHSIEEAVFMGQTIVVMEKAAIRKIIENPYFGDRDIRAKPSYHQVCEEVRQWLGVEGATR